jgi:hypothetical protein
MSWNNEEYLPLHHSPRIRSPAGNIAALSQVSPTGRLYTQDPITHRTVKLNPHTEHLVQDFLAPKGTTIRRGVSPGRTLRHLRTPKNTLRYLKFKNELSKKANNMKISRWEREERPVLQAQRDAIFRRGREELAANVREIQARRFQEEMAHERRMLNLAHARAVRHRRGEYSDSDSNGNRSVNIDAIGGAKRRPTRTRKTRRRQRV